MNKALDNYVCDGQMDITDFLDGVQQLPSDPKPVEYKKPVIYHMGLSAYYYQCPYCGCCGKYFDGVVERKTKDLIECEKQLGSGGGAVYKDDKGNWHYSDL